MGMYLRPTSKRNPRRRYWGMSMALPQGNWGTLFDFSFIEGLSGWVASICRRVRVAQKAPRGEGLEISTERSPVDSW